MLLLKDLSSARPSTDRHLGAMNHAHAAHWQCSYHFGALRGQARGERFHKLQHFHNVAIFSKLQPSICSHLRHLILWHKPWQNEMTYLAQSFSTCSLLHPASTVTFYVYSASVALPVTNIPVMHTADRIRRQQLPKCPSWHFIFPRYVPHVLFVSFSPSLEESHRWFHKAIAREQHPKPRRPKRLPDEELQPR